MHYSGLENRSISCFSTVKEVLDKLYSQVPAFNSIDRDKRIQFELQKLSDNYEGEKLANNFKGIDYNSLITKFAYTYTYIACHADLVYQIIKSVPQLEEALQKELVNISCIGSGPGSEILGIAKYLRCVDKAPRLNFDLYDREYSWEIVWQKLLDKRYLPKNTDIYSRVLDIANFAPENYTRIFKTEIYTMVYVLSELYANKRKAFQFF